MGCGNGIKTVCVIGKESNELVLSLAEREKVRVLHILTSAGDPVMPETDSYRMINADLSDRIINMALFMQYNFPLIICPENDLTQELYTVCKEQWHGEYSQRSLLLVQEGSFLETSFESDSLPAKTQKRVNPDPLFDILLR